MVSLPGKNPNLQVGLVLMRTRDASVALEWFMSSVARYPSCAESHYWTGILLCQANRFQEGMLLLERAVSISPVPEYLLSLIDACAHLGCWAEAVSAFERLFALKAPSPDWRYRYALSQLHAGNVVAAVTALEGCLEMDAACEPAMTLLGDLYMKTNRHVDARHMLERSYLNGVRTTSLFRLLSRCCTDMGDAKRALEVLAEAVQCFPNSLQFHYFAALIDLSAIPDTVWASLDQGLALEQSDSEQAIYRHFLLARRACVNGQFDVELQELARAHALVEQRATFAVPKDVYLKQLPDSVVSGRKLEQVTRASELELFLFVGMPRTGSTLLENVLCAGVADLVKGEEVSACADAFFKAFDVSNNSVDLEVFQSAVMATYRQCNLLRDGYGLTDKSLDNAFFLDAILAVFPRARVIWCQREVVASIISIYQRNLSLAWAHSLEDIAAYAETLDSVMKIWLRRFAGRILIVRHEDVIRDPEAESRRMFDFLGRAWNPACLSVDRRQHAVSRTSSSMQIRSGIRTGSGSAWANYGELLGGFKPNLGCHE